MSDTLVAMSWIEDPLSAGATIVEAATGREFAVLARGGVANKTVWRDSVLYPCEFCYIVQGGGETRDDVYQIDISYSEEQKCKYFLKKE